MPYSFLATGEDRANANFRFEPLSKFVASLSSDPQDARSFFPLPVELASDDASQVFIRRTMAAWIDGSRELDQLSDDERNLLDAVQVVITK